MVRHRSASRPAPRATDARRPATTRFPVPWGWAALVVGLVVAAHWPAIGAGLIWDDDVNLTGNPHLRDAAGLCRLWLQLGATNMYAPLSFTTLWAGYQCWGLDPLGYHLVNLAWHAVSALLLAALLGRLLPRGAWFGAALFAVHPALVESVAWVTELRNVQSMAFYLLSLLAFTRLVALDDRDEPRGRRRWALAALTLVFYAAGLLSKPSGVGLPVVMLLLAWWKRGRLTRDVWRWTAPVFALALAAGAVAMHVDAQYSGGSGPAWDMTLVERLLVASRAYWFYVATLCWPHPLVPIYPRWEADAAAWGHYVFPVATLATLSALWLLRARIGRGPLVAAVSFGLLVAPTTGLFRFSYHLYAFVADRYVYHGAPALVALVAAGASEWRAGLPKAWQRRASSAAGVALLIVLGALSLRHGEAFQSEMARCRYTLERNPTAWVAMNNLGVALKADGKPQEAIGWYRKALEHRPVYPEAQSNLGVALMALGQPAEAKRHYEEALRIWPDYAAALNNLGTALAALGDRSGALQRYREAIGADPNHAEAHNNLATMLASNGEVQAAIREHEEALRLNPDYAQAYHDLGVTLAAAGRHAEAIAAYREALRRGFVNGRIHANLGGALAATGEYGAAVEHYREATRLDPGDAAAQIGWGIAQFSRGRPQDAIPHFQEAVRLGPANPEAHNNLGAALASTGDLGAAIRHFAEAVRLRPGDAGARVNLGKALLSAGEAADAVLEFEEALRTSPGSADAHHFLGLGLIETGRRDRAVEHFQAALRIDPGHTRARDALDRLRSGR